MWQPNVGDNSEIVTTNYKRMEKTVQTNHYGEIKLNNELDIISLITKLRNDLIKDFLDERLLKEYFHAKYMLAELSNVKIQFIRKDLKELYMSQLDTKHYQSIIEEIKNNERISLAEGNEQLFYKEIENILQKYIY